MVMSVRQCLSKVFGGNNWVLIVFMLQVLLCSGCCNKDTTRSWADWAKIGVFLFMLMMVIEASATSKLREIMRWFIGKLFGPEGRYLHFFLICFAIFSTWFWFEGGDCHKCIGVRNDDIERETMAIGECTSIDRKCRDIFSSTRLDPLLLFTSKFCKKKDGHDENDWIYASDCLDSLNKQTCGCGNAAADYDHDHGPRIQNSSNYRSATCVCTITEEFCDNMRIMQLVEAILYSVILTIFLAISDYRQNKRISTPTETETPRPIAIK